MEEVLNYKVEERMIMRGYIRYIIPTTIALIFSQIAPLVDSYCISSTLGEEALSAMSTVNPIYYLFNIIASFAGIGGGIGIGKAVGSGDKYAGGRVFTKTIVWMSATALLLSAVCLALIGPILGFLSATEGNYAYAKEYLSVLIVGMVFYVNNYALTYILTDDNDVTLSMAGGIVSGLVNMVIDVIGMFVLHQGIWIAAFGTVMGACTGCLVFMLHMRKKDRVCRFTRKRNDVADVRLSEIISPGMPEALQNLLFTIQIIQSNFILSTSIGTSGLGNAAVIENLELIAVVIIAGISESALPIFASYYGEGNGDINRIVKRNVIIAGIVVMIPFVLSLLIYPGWLMIFFSIDEPVMVELLPRAIRIMALAQIFAVIGAILISFMQSTDDEKRAAASIFIQGIVHILVLLALSKVCPNDAPWIAAFVAYGTVLCYFILYCGQFKDFSVRNKENILMIRGGTSDEANINKWQEEAAEYLTEDETGMLGDKLFCPFMKALDKEREYMCSFMVIKKADGHKSAILRYDSRKDLIGDEDSSEQVDQEKEPMFGECIRSEFNYVRRLMINFR